MHEPYQVAYGGNILIVLRILGSGLQPRESQRATKLAILYWYGIHTTFIKLHPVQAQELYIQLWEYVGMAHPEGIEAG